MACGCAAQLPTYLQAGAGVSITGLGTEQQPYRITAATSESALNFTDTQTVDLSKTGSGTATSPFEVSARVILDPQGGIVAGPSGISIALDTTAGNVLQFVAGKLRASNTVPVSTEANNAVEQRADGLYVASSNAGFSPAQLAAAKLSDIGDVPASFTAGQMLYRGASAWTAVTLGNGIAAASGVISLVAKPNFSVTVDSAGIGVAVRTSGGVKHSSTGLEVDTTVIASQSDLTTLRTELFGGPTRTRAPSLEIRGPTYTQNAGTGDIFAQGGWTAFNGDLDSMLRTAGSTSVGDSPYDRIVIPIAGRYEVDFWAESDAVTGTQACKVTLNSRTVNTSSIASDLNRAGGEGTPLHASANLILAAGNVLYWSTFTDTNTTWRSQWYGIYTKIVVRWVGPR
jgi:hypothetical protein